MRYIFPTLFAASVFFCSGCAEKEGLVSYSQFEIWDCRGERPRRIMSSDSTSADSRFSKDPLIPHFTGLKAPAETYTHGGPNTAANEKK